jgi:hypothetical protein
MPSKSVNFVDCLESLILHVPLRGDLTLIYALCLATALIPWIGGDYEIAFMTDLDANIQNLLSIP